VGHLDGGGRAGFTISRLKSEGLSPEDVFKSETLAMGSEGAWRDKYLNSVKAVYEQYGVQPVR
jgi:hypothetical protein